jgi:hypothetical protein
MSDLQLIEAVKAGDLAATEQLIGSGADINQQDEHGWTPLNWASGKGDVALIKLLVENGADVFKVGTDQRTPYLIALAAGHAEAARLLIEAEDRTGSGKTSRMEKKYCKAYLLSALRQFPGWSESRINWKEAKDDLDAETVFTDESVVFIHQDFTVTESMWHNENVIFNQVTPEWKEFCASALDFKVPDDFDLIVSALAANPAAAD